MNISKQCERKVEKYRAYHDTRTPLIWDLIYTLSRHTPFPCVYLAHPLNHTVLLHTPP